MKTTVWTKQHTSVLDILSSEGRYTAKKEYIIKDLQEHANLVLEVYDWYVRNAAKKYPKPEDVSYPVWVSFSPEATMLLSDNYVVLKLEIESDSIMPVNISKWGIILNYGYIPINDEDEKRHNRLLADYNVSDAKAYMSQFYPNIKHEIISSWSRLFDDSIIIDNSNEYGTIWELRKEWVLEVMR